jgi:hypothetical protein
MLETGGGRRAGLRVLRLGRTAGTRGLDVLPFPGTPDAAASSQITFPALLPNELRLVTVTGSASGRHAGRIAALPGGRGTAFVPARPFAAGERVAVVARLSAPAAGTVSGAPDASALQFSFTVARSAAGATQPTTPSASNPPKPKASATLSFESEPDLNPPAVKVSGLGDPASGDVFVTVQHGPQQGPMILDGKGQLVWFRPLPSKQISAIDLRVQRYRGRPVLTWWQGRVAVPLGYGVEGEDVILDDRYQTVATLRAGEGYSSDLHELELTPQGTALITAFTPVRANLSSVGGPVDGTVLDSVVQEIDVKTGRLLWEWHALGHVPLSASEAGTPKAGTPYDYFHINSIQQLRDGNLLICARNTWAIYEVSRTTGKLVWSLGGKSSTFRMGKGTNFEWQHDARLQHDGTVTVFDDAGTPKEESQSRALRLRIDTATMKATLEHPYTHTPPVLAAYEGGMQLLRNGNVFVDWGTEPNFSEYTPDGKQIFNGSFSGSVQSYRAYRFTWSADPSTRPAISARIATDNHVMVYASWNGATNVARWQLLAGTSRNGLSLVATTPRRGFETAIKATTGERYFAVRALDDAGRVLATSAVIAR